MVSRLVNCQGIPSFAILKTKFTLKSYGGNMFRFNVSVQTAGELGCEVTVHARPQTIRGFGYFGFDQCQKIL